VIDWHFKKGVKMTVGKYINNLWYMIDRITTLRAVKNVFNCKASDELTDEIKNAINVVYESEWIKDQRRIEQLKFAETK
jgi:hypothetical protein